MTPTDAGTETAVDGMQVTAVRSGVRYAVSNTAVERIGDGPAVAG